MIGRAAVVVGGCTALSRVAGFLRDVLIAATLGAGPVADAFFVSLKLANFLRRLFAEGAFNAAFIPVYLRVRDEEGAPAAARFAGEAMSALALALVAVVALAELGMPVLVRVLASGFAPDSDRFRLAVELSRATFPYLLFISLAALLSGLLQASGRFAAAAMAPILLNLVLIAVLLTRGRDDSAEAASWLAWGVTAAGTVQLAWVALAARRSGLLPAPQPPRPSPAVRRVARLMGPGFVGLGVVQINILVSSWFATHLAPGTVAYLFYADRLIQLPLGIVGVALATALLPALSRAARTGEAGRAMLNRALEVALLLGLPAAAGLGLLAQPIIAVLFERGAFGPEATAATAEMLAVLALGLPAYLLSRVLGVALFAREDTMTPVWSAAAALVLNATLAALLTGPLGHVGLAIAMSASSWLNAAGLAWVLWRRGQFGLDAPARRRLVGILGALAAMAAALLVMPPDIAWPLGRTAGLLVAIGGGGLLFFAAAWLCGGFSPRDLRGLLRPSRA